MPQDKKSAFPELQEKGRASPKPEKNLYDIINSQDLEILYKKNAHLLERLSRTGRENTQLYTRLSSLAKEKSHLGGDNLILKSRLKGLKEQISLFARQHREFNSQSQKLKRELEKAKTIEAAPDSDSPQEASAAPAALPAAKLRLLEKKEQVYRKQIERLQSLYKQAQAEKHFELGGAKTEHQRDIQELENKIKRLDEALEEKNSLLEQSRKSAQKKSSDSKNIEHYKQQIAELQKEKERQRSGFASQIELFHKERAALKFQCGSLQKALDAGKLGFDQAMLSFRRKYAELYKSQKAAEEKLKSQEAGLPALREEANRIRARALTAQEEAVNQINREKDKQISSLCGELKAYKEHNKDLESQIQSLRLQSKDLFSKEKKQMQEEINSLKWNQEKSARSFEESRIKEAESLKSDYERRINNLSEGFKTRLSHIRAEMENDLCSERKRYEVFKNMKMKESAELKESLLVLQEENSRLKAKHSVLQRSAEETKASMEKHLRNSQRLKDQAEHLKNLWQDIQKQNESKEQQIRSLQKLNKSLSLSLNKMYPQVKSGASPEGEKKGSLQSKPESDEENPSNSHVLADLHFD